MFHRCYVLLRRCACRISALAPSPPGSGPQGLFSTSEVRIERGFYCCYDPLTRLDVRCELCIPGGVVCGALDCEGNVHDVTPELWRNCVVRAGEGTTGVTGRVCSAGPPIPTRHTHPMHTPNA